jgi:hypothetical protein
MKFAVAGIVVASTVLLLGSSPGFSQQQTGSSAVSSNSSSQQSQSPGLSLPSPGPTIRVIGSPTVQPFRGLGIECTPVEQEIVGVIIGPTNLCDR